MSIIVMQAHVPQIRCISLSSRPERSGVEGPCFQRPLFIQDFPYAIDFRDATLGLFPADFCTELTAGQSNRDFFVDINPVGVFEKLALGVEDQRVTAIQDRQR